MSSVSLPCPSCSTSLILDEENAGSEVVCPGCNARLLMPATVSEKVSPTLLGPATNPKGRTAPRPSDQALPAAAKAALPKSRTKSDEEERKRLAAAAAAAGGAHSFTAEDVSLPSDHRPVVLPSKRPVAVPEAESPTPAVPAPPGGIPTARRPSSPAGQPGREGPDKQYKSREAVEIGVQPTVGPSRFVRPAEDQAPAPASKDIVPSGAEEGEEIDASLDSESGGDATVRGGYRLGLGRELHFSPMPTADTDGETATWGAKVETEAQAARGRRFVSLAVCIAVLAAGGVAFYMLRQAVAKPQQDAALVDDGQESASVSAEDVMRNVEDARRVLKRFLEADSIEKMAREVRHPEVTIPRMERFYAANPLKPRKIRTESQSWSEIRIEDTEFIRAAMELDDFIVYPVTLEIIPGAEPKVDWESFVHWAEMPWKDFLRTPPEQPMDYRVTVTLDPRDQYYNYSFKGRELDLLCFKLEDPGKYGSCWAYCDKDSEAATKLLFNLKRSRQQGIVNDEGKTAISCILRLRFPPEGLKTNQVMIEKFLHDSWVQP